MNVFYTNADPIQSAIEHCVVHTRKMIVEYCQLMATAKRMLDGQLIKVWVERLDGEREVEWYALPSDKFTYRNNKRYLVHHEIYKHSHMNHPSAVWVRASSKHYEWVWRCASHLCRLYQQETGREHGSYSQLMLLAPMPQRIPELAFVQPPQAMPDEYKNLDATVGYQQYLCAKFDEWQSRAKPIAVSFYFKTPEWYV